MSAKETRYSWSKFYWDEWGNDGALQNCGMAAQGLWINLLRLMFNSERQGYLQINNQPMTILQIAKRTGFDPRTIKKQLTILIENKVCSIDENGVVYSRRMVRENMERIRRSGGKVAADTMQSCSKVDSNLQQVCSDVAASLQEEMAENSQKKQNPLYKNRIEKNRIDNIPPLIPPAEEKQTKPKSTNPAEGILLPADWVLSEKNRAYAISKGLDPNETAEMFSNHWWSVNAKTNKKAYKRDWDAAFRTWCGKAREYAKNRGNIYPFPKQNQQASGEVLWDYAGEHDEQFQKLSRSDQSMVKLFEKSPNHEDWYINHLKNHNPSVYRYLVQKGSIQKKVEVA